MNSKSLASVVIPTFNSAEFVEQCLQSIKQQSYNNVEIIIVDGFSADKTVEIARKYTDKIYRYGPDQSKVRIFGASYQRNYGVTRAKGKFIYYVDVDMVLTKHVIASCVTEAEKGADAVIIPEESFGESYWAACKALERCCYWGDDLVEAPRFLRKEVWNKLGGLDLSICGGGDDWDLYKRLKTQGYKVVRTSEIVLHNEGKLTLKKLIKKRYLYGKYVRKYLQRYRVDAYKQFLPVRLSYLKNWRLFIRNPVHAVGFIIMRLVEYMAGLSGLLFSLICSEKVQLKEEVRK